MVPSTNSLRNTVLDHWVSSSHCHKFHSSCASISPHTKSTYKTHTQFRGSISVVGYIYIIGILSLWDNIRFLFNTYVNFSQITGFKITLEFLPLPVELWSLCTVLYSSFQFIASHSPNLGHILPDDPKSPVLDVVEVWPNIFVDWGWACAAACWPKRLVVCVVPNPPNEGLVWPNAELVVDPKRPVVDEAFWLFPNNPVLVLLDIAPETKLKQTKLYTTRI